MYLEHSLCQVDPNDRCLLHGCLLPCGWSCNITSVAHFDAFGRGRPPHQNPIKLLMVESLDDSVRARNTEDAKQPVLAERRAMGADRTVFADRRSGQGAG